ncbi:MAG TPA: hypothetical protein VEH29_14145, partial [Acidimicrobiales bacterium]|nr:hypothetical protein [Acidimicrobiales bacterium]
LVEVATRSARAARYCRDSLLALDGVEPAAMAPVLREFALRTPVEPGVLIERLLEEGFLAGTVVEEGFVDTSYAGSLLVATTERRTRAEIDSFVAAFDKAVR